MRAVVFDLDGTLVDSLPDIAASVNHVLGERGFAPLARAEVAPMIGDGIKMLLTRALAARGAEARPSDLDQAMDYYLRHVAESTAAYPGIIDVLGRLRAAGHQMAVCTNKNTDAARLVLDALGLAEFFAVVTGGDSTEWRKPDPRHLAATLAELGVEEAVMIGDHENDMAAARGLGVPSIFVSWGYGKATGDRVAQAACELPAIIAALD